MRQSDGTAAKIHSFADLVNRSINFALTSSDGQPLPPSFDPDQPFSEMAMYVLVRRNGDWWLAAGQNTPIRPGGAVPAGN
jgi:hypothetical protein